MSANPFIYCLNTSTIRPTPLLEKIELAGRAGFGAIEPWIDEVDAFLANGGSLAELRKALADTGLEVVSMIALGDWLSPDPGEHARALGECRRRMSLAVALGSPTIVASPPQEQVDLAFASARFSEMIALGLELGIVPAMEFLGFVDGIHTLAAARAIVEGSSDPEAPVVADVFHLIRGGGSVDDLLGISGGRLSCFHLNDLPAFPDPRIQTDADRVMPGDGIADLPRVIAHLRSIGFEGPLSLELFNRELWSRPPLEVLERGIDRMRALVEG